MAVISRRRASTRPCDRAIGTTIGSFAGALAGWSLLAATAMAADWTAFLRDPAAAFSPAAESGPIVPPGENRGAGSDIALVLAEEVEAERQGSCGPEAEACQDALERLRDDELAGIDLDIRVGGRAGRDYPCECRLEGETFAPRRFAATTFTWTAAANCHKPLYFEDWQLERYGHSHGALADPFVSAAHFFVTLPVLPYKMGVELPWECVYPLGHYRPGSCAPRTVPAPAVSGRGLAVQAATVTGLVFLFP